MNTEKQGKSPKAAKIMPETPLNMAGSLELPPQIVAIIWALEMKQPTRVSCKVDSATWTVRKRADCFYLEAFYHYTEGVEAGIRVRSYSSDLAEIKRRRKTVEISYENLLGPDPGAAEEQKRKLDEFDAEEERIRALMAPYAVLAKEFEQVQLHFQEHGKSDLFSGSKFCIASYSVPRPSPEMDLKCVLSWEPKIQEQAGAA